MNNGTPLITGASTVAVAGATGYVGGRLVPRLLDGGCHVRCLVRDQHKILARPWGSNPRVSLVLGDLSAEDTVASALAGCRVAFYLVHSMKVARREYARRDREIAGRFARAAHRAGVARIIYLGGLGETGDGLSEHLASRREVESALASTPVPVTVLRAAMIIGAGSASFETLRYLVERLPVMITPRWVHTECQPIAIGDVLNYLVACLSTPETTGKTLDIGGAEAATYVDIMQTMARALGLRARRVIPVPVLTPHLSSLWIHLVTPVSKDIARPLAEGLRNRVVCRNDEASRLMPGRRLTITEAVSAALEAHSGDGSSTSWTDAGVIPGDPDWAGGKVFVDRRATRVRVPPAETFGAVCRVGGKQGWYSAGWLWRLRGAIDRLAGGPGLSRGRRHPEEIRYGDALDFWRVTDIDPHRRLALRAEMKLPGDAELEFAVQPDGRGTRLTQTARFKPRGLGGLLYWWAVLPVHHFVFQRMLGGIRRDAEKGDGEGRSDRARRADRR
ncbi:MAG: SDR family oxidoreductase [Candidatus Krumholzibacteria bacterium]|nr:SDR family oxidoreductase [Candidatus Krumholzibacteria bacterium]